MTEPLIGICTSGRNEQDNYTQSTDYVWAVYQAGGAPVLLPPVADGKLAGAWLRRLDGLIFTGGGDIDPERYGQESHPGIFRVDPERDRAEIGLARAAWRADIPVLAICRGLQVVNVALGGTLFVEVSDYFGKRVHHHMPDRAPGMHSVRLAPDSRLAQLLGTECVNGVSWHHQAIDRLADGLVVTGHAPDGVIEAVEAPGKRWFLGVQWHPEMSVGTDVVQQRLFQALVQAAGATQAEAAGARTHAAEPGD